MDLILISVDDNTRLKMLSFFITKHVTTSNDIKRHDADKALDLFRRHHLNIEEFRHIILMIKLNKLGQFIRAI